MKLGTVLFGVFLATNKSLGGVCSIHQLQECLLVLTQEGTTFESRRWQPGKKAVLSLRCIPDSRGYCQSEDVIGVDHEVPYMLLHIIAVMIEGTKDKSKTMVSLFKCR